MATNLPSPTRSDSAENTKVYFETYDQKVLEFQSSDVDATIGFFQNKGFDRDAAESVSSTLLRQAKLENIPIFNLLDQLKGFDSVELSALIAEILNNNRPATSAIGFKPVVSSQNFKTRNIIV